MLVRRGQQFKEDMMSSRSTLSYIIIEAIAAYPDDASSHILEFLSRAATEKDSDITSMEKEAFFKAWNRCILKSKAFGVKSATDPAAFCDDFIKELTYSCEASSELSGLLNEFSTENFARDSYSKSLHTMSNIGRGLLSALNESYRHTDQLDGFSSFDEAMLAQRQRKRGAKFSLDANSKKPLLMLSPYRPLSQTLLGSMEHVYGHMLLKHKHSTPSPAELSSYKSEFLPDDLPIVGVRLTDRRGIITYQARAWAIYYFLYEAAAVGGNICIFPSPQGIEKLASANNVDTIFIYEQLSPKPIVPLFGINLAHFLRNYPTIIHAWCLQLSVAIDILLRPDITILQHFIPSDLYVLDNGLLALGNIAIVKQNCPRGEDKKKRERVVDFFSSILRSCLCLSRQHTVDLRVNSREVHAESEDMDGNKEVISVMEGCTLDLTFTATSISLLHITRREEGGRDFLTQMSEDTAIIDISKNLGVVDVTVDASNKILKLTAISEGSLQLRVSVCGVSNSVTSIEMSSGYNCLPSQSSRDIRIEVVKATPILSVDLIELIALLELSFTGSKESYLAAQCFQRGGVGPAWSNYLSEESRWVLAKDWAGRIAQDKSRLLI